SSRRRHTRFSRDWSSDVCSSDLDKAMVAYDKLSDEIRRTGGCDPMKLMRLSSRAEGARVALIAAARAHVAAGDAGRELEAVKARSEERRGGKEGRGRWVRGEAGE